MTSRPLLAIVTLLALADPAWADEPAADEPASEAGDVRVGAGVDVVDAYVFRGLVDDTGGFIVQPRGHVAVTAFRAADGAVRSLDVVTSFSSSLHASEVGATRSPEFLYEIEPRLAVELGLVHRIQLGLHYAFDTSPSGAFDPVHRLQLHSSVSFGPDDGAWWVAPRLEIAVPIATGESPYLYTGIGMEIGYEIWADATTTLSGWVPIDLGFTLVGADESGLGPDGEPRYRFASTGAALSLATATEVGTLGIMIAFEVHHASSRLRRGVGQGKAAQTVARAGVQFEL